MKSHIRQFLTEKQQAGALNEDFYNQVSIYPERIEGIIKGELGASSKETHRIAAYFGVTYESLVKSEPLQLAHICQFCNEPFIPGNRKAKYCSDTCRNRAFRASN